MLNRTHGGESSPPLPWKKVQRQEMTMFETIRRLNIPDKAQREECEKTKKEKKGKHEKIPRKSVRGEFGIRGIFQKTKICFLEVN